MIKTARGPPAEPSQWSSIDIGAIAYWPPLIILDGDTLCSMAFLERQEYLVVADRSTRYGVFLAGGCTRTQPLTPRTVDLRTLDGSLCAGPGWTLIGSVSNWADQQPVRNAELVFRDFAGEPYATRSDDEGVYVLQHLPPGPYTVDSQISPGISAFGGREVNDRLCTESSVYFRRNP